MGLTNPAYRLPGHVAVALREGRYRPGNGPWYCSRILPENVPLIRQELLDSGVSRWCVDTRYDAVAHGVLLPTDTERTDEDCGAYRHCVIMRARAQLLLHPECVLGGWGAAGYHGLKYWADAAPVLLLNDTVPPRDSDVTADAAEFPLRAAVRALPSDFDLERDTVTPDPALPTLRVVSAPLALAQCLRSVLSGKHDWRTVDIDGLSHTDICAVQLLDAFTQCTTITHTQIREACRGIVGSRQLKRLLALSMPGAESPRETELRLFVREMLPDSHVWETQFGVQYREETSLGGTRTRATFFDLACRDLRIGLYYDGKHHEDADQTEKDFEQLQDLRDGQWIVVRINRKLMANPRKMLRQIALAIAAAVIARNSAE